MTCITWRHVAAALASWTFGTTAVLGAPIFTQAGDASFRNITATGGALSGVDVSSALVHLNGASSTLAVIGQQATSAVPMSLASQPNGWLQLDGNGLVPAAALPAITNSVDPVARSTAAAASAAASAALPESLLGQPNGVAPLDGSGLVPLATLPSSVTNPVDATARATANAAIPSSQRGAASGVAPLDGNSLVPVTNINPASSATDAVARAAANAAQTTATAAIPASQKGAASGVASLTSSSLIPTAQIDPTSIATDPTARSTASAAQTTAASAQATANAAIPSSQKGAASGVAALDSNTYVPVANINPASVATDSTARAAASAATAIANAAIPSSTLGQANGPAQLSSASLLSPAILPLGSNAAFGAMKGDGSTISCSAGVCSALGTGSVSLATSTKAGTVPSVNAPGGAPLLDSSGTLSGQLAAANAQAVARALAAQRNDVVYAADYGVACNDQTLGDVAVASNGSTITLTSNSYQFNQNDVGSNVVGGYQNGALTGVTIASVSNGVATISSSITDNEPAGTGTVRIWHDDTADLQKAFNYATSALRLGGTRLELPGGQCDLSAEIDVSATRSLSVIGQGEQATDLNWIGATNGLLINMTNGASVTLGDFMVSKTDGANGYGTNDTTTAERFVGTAIALGSSNAQEGEVSIGNVAIYPGGPVNTNAGTFQKNPSAQNDGWNQSLHLFNIGRARVDHVIISMPGSLAAGSLSDAPAPSLYNSGVAVAGTYSAALPFGVAAGIVLDGVNSGANGGNYAIDNSFSNIDTAGGNVSFDASHFQGIYISDSKLTYAMYGFRSDGSLPFDTGITNTSFAPLENWTQGGSINELVTMAGCYTFSYLADAYLNGDSFNTLVGNVFWTGGSPAGSWEAVWFRNTNNDSFDGNNVLGTGWHMSAPAATATFASGATAIPVSSTAYVSSGNELYDITTPGATPLPFLISNPPYSGNTIALSQATAAASSTATDTIIQAPFIGVAGAASAGATSFSVGSTAHLFHGMILVDYSNAAVFPMVDNAAFKSWATVQSLSGTTVTVDNGHALQAAMAAGDVIEAFTPDYGEIASWDGSSGGNYPHVASSNTFSNIEGPALANAVKTGNSSGTGNSIAESVGGLPGVLDPNWGFGAGAVSSNYFGNAINGGAIEDDGNRNVRFVKNLGCGDIYDTCVLTQMNTGTLQFSAGGAASYGGGAGGATDSVSFAAPNLYAAGTVSNYYNSQGTSAGHLNQTFNVQGYFGSGTLSTNGITASAGNLGPLQTGTVHLRATISCINGSSYASWTVTGIWGGSPFASLASTFAATADPGTTIPSGWTMTAAALDGSPTTSGYPELVLGGAPGNTDCSGHVEELNIQ